MSEINKKPGPLHRAHQAIMTTLKVAALLQLIWNGAVKLWEVLEWLMNEGPGIWPF